MANKKLLGNATSELRLPTKKVKGEKKPKWQAKTGGKKKVEPVVETPEVVAAEEVVPTEPADAPVLPTTLEEGNQPGPTRRQTLMMQR